MNAQKDTGGEVASFWRLPALIVIFFNAVFLLYYSFWNFWGLVNTEADVLRGLWYGGFLEMQFWPHIVLWLICIWVAVVWYVNYQRFVVCIYELAIIFKGGIVRIIERITCFIVTIWFIVYLIINILAVYYAFY